MRPRAMRRSSAYTIGMRRSSASRSPPVHARNSPVTSGGEVSGIGSELYHRNLVYNLRRAKSPLQFFRPVPAYTAGSQVQEVVMNYASSIAVALLAGSSTIYAAEDPVSNWNTVAVQATLTAGQNAITQSR